MPLLNSNRSLVIGGAIGGAVGGALGGGVAGAGWGALLSEKGRRKHDIWKGVKRGAAFGAITMGVAGAAGLGQTARWSNNFKS